MLFIMGITDGRKDLSFHQVVTCPACHKYGSYRVFVVYTVLTIFFIPIFKWNRRYYVETGCCGTIYELNTDKGRCIERGEPVEIEPDDLERQGAYGGSGYGQKTCMYCGFSTAEDFDFCPKCGKRF